MKRSFITAACITALAASGSAQALLITPTTDGNTLANTILGPGISIVPGSINYIGAPNQGGTFTGGIASGLGIDEGIILTSGDATLAPGPNTADDTSSVLSTPGDSDLDAESGESTNDANVLEFDFTTSSSSLFFNFVFASEEYNEFIDSFNDPFAFFLNGVNIALVPGTSDVVSVDNVNCGNPFDASGSTGDNCGLFNNNDLDDGGPFFDIEYDGFTDVFTASASGLGSGVNTMKLVIADAEDFEFDSAVFIEANTFSDEDTTSPVPAPPTTMLLLAGLGAAGCLRRRRTAR